VPRIQHRPGGLAARGFGSGDVIAFQLPNWAETIACYYGLSLLGAVMVPVPHIYGRREIEQILGQSRARDVAKVALLGRQRQNFTVSFEPTVIGVLTRMQAPDGDMSSSVAGTTFSVPAGSSNRTSALAQMAVLGSMARSFMPSVSAWQPGSLVTSG